MRAFSKRALVVVLCTIPLMPLRAQEPIEQVLSWIEEPEQRQAVGDRLTEFYNQPLDLNTATSEELGALPWVDDFFVRNFLLYRTTHGPLRSIYELRDIQGAPVRWLPLLAPFICVRKEETSGASGQREREKKYLFVGSSLHHQQGSDYRLIYNSQRSRGWSWTVVGDHDRGEPWRAPREGMLDFLSLSTQRDITHNAATTKVIVGDYSVSKGQGLVLGMKLGYFTKMESSSDFRSVRARGLKAHRSFAEYDYLRGVAVEHRTKRGWQVLLFAGALPIDARVEGSKIRTIYRTGIHRSPLEIASRKSVHLQAIGASVAYETVSSRVGLTALGSRYRIASKGERRYLSHHATPSSQISLEWDWKPSNSLQWYGEGAIIPQRRDSHALVGGVRYRSELFGTYSLQMHYIGARYQSAFGNPDSFFSSGNNEKGWRIAWMGEIARYVEGSLFLEKGSSVISDGRRRSSEGSNVIALLTYRKDHTLVRLRARRNIRKDNEAKTSLSLSTDLPISPIWRIKAGIQTALKRSEKSSLGLYTRAVYRHKNWHSELGVHYFRATASFSPLLANIPYMPHLYYTPFLRGEGVRLNSSLHYTIHDSLRLHARLSHTIYKQTPTTPLPTSLDLSVQYTLPYSKK